MNTTAEKVLDVLKAYRLTEHRGGQYRCNSPLRPNSDSHAFTVVIAPDGEHGAYHDNVSGEHGSLYDLAEKLGIPVERQVATITKRAYIDLADYAGAHGVSAEVFETAGWKFVQHEGRPALEIQTKTGTRWRYLDGESPRFKHPAGYVNCWYGLRRAVDLATKHTQPLVLCNGAPSVVVAQHHGVAAASLSSSAHNIPDELMAELRQAWNGDLIIAMDCDKEGAEATRRFYEQMPTAHIVDLGLTAGGDLADFCRLYGADSAKELKARAVKFDKFADEQDIKTLASALGQLTAARKSADAAARGKLPELLDRAQFEIDTLRYRDQSDRLVSFDELVDRNHKGLLERVNNPQPIRGLRSHIPRLDRAIGGWVSGRLHVIYGDTNMGKSTLGVSIAANFMKHTPGLVLPTESPPAQYLDKFAAFLANVRYDGISDGELSPDELHRVEGAYAMMQKGNCHIVDAGSPTPAALAAYIREGVRQHGYKWVLVDSLSKMKVPGTNDIYETTRLVADALQDIARECNIVLLATVQIGRNLKDRSNKMPLPNDALGAGTVEQNADVILSIYRHEQYVKLGTAENDPRFPPGTAVVRILKHRWKEIVAGDITLRFAGGAGFYEMETDERLMRSA